VGELLARAFTEQALLDAWADARDAALADGVAGPEVEQFEVGAARRISQLAESLADGTFTPGPLVRVDIAKPAGGLRRLEVPSLADRIVERALLAELDAVIDPLLLPWSFALPARPGCAGRAGLPGGSPRRWRGVGGTRRRQRLLRPHPALGGAAPGPRGSDRHAGRRPGAAAGVG
jgi:hypothetical protein